MEAGRDTGHAIMKSRDSDCIDLLINGVQERYQIVKVIEFDSDRKMMTVVVRNEKTGRVYAFNKGADVAILPRIKNGEGAEQANADVLEISRKGLRALVYSMKELPNQMLYTDYDVESDLTLLGITGVEDAL